MAYLIGLSALRKTIRLLNPLVLVDLNLVLVHIGTLLDISGDLEQEGTRPEPTDAGIKMIEIDDDRDRGTYNDNDRDRGRDKYRDR